ncbi:hypothetical protein LTR10_020953 [Elasticomyces elasticus]|uniref:Uncharacterized protein n=1 Tax=Exophiala sideris TaxID=1016849 RepID=A0ABR0JC08_9EURO|nr:hypothetical protein LTR10_020953 [Elasticomyces elasticus]KAK5031088.1 hypothetical protein LTS07_004823 [Exophiala sideris]KAK5038810.1 hypothetical protein LTR13_003841 [Exophiala sideris]KAK5060693.1 hypothetical protein LTR69_005292 [Exophiala sideris]KAK5183606.1 hypothetical protein LTR44_003888 [Eurotiomycetes sp. CCFEE 6388]
MATRKSTSLTVDDYEFPRGAKGLATVVGAALFVLSTRRQFIEPRSVIHDHILARSVTAATYSKTVQDVIFYWILGVHGAGTAHFAYTKLQQYNVKLTSMAWFQWILTVFLGGSAAVKHFDDFVEKKELKAVKDI